MSLRVLLTLGVPDFTGASKMAFYYARSFVEAGHEVLCVCGPRPQGGASAIEPLRSSGVKVSEEHGFSGLLDRALIGRLAGFIGREDIDVVVSAQQIDLKVAAWAARAAGVPCVGFIQNRTAFSGHWPLRLIKRLGYQFTVARGTSRLICISEAVRDQHCREFSYPQERTVVLENGIELSTHRPLERHERARLRNELGLNERDIVLLNVGRLDPQKGQRVLLEAFAEARFADRPVKLVLVGDVTAGNESTAKTYVQGLRQFVDVRGLKDRVIFAGWRNDVERLLEAADAYVHSALWEGNSLPLALLEAMAARLPVIGTNCAGHPAGFVQSVHGYIVPKGEMLPLARAMEQLVGTSDEARRAMGQLARTMVEDRYDIAVTGHRFVDFVAEVAGYGAQVRLETSQAV